MDKIAVLIPCYNEEKRLKRLSGMQKRRFRRLLFMYITTILPTALQSWQKKAGAVVRQEYKQGKGNVIRRMFQEVDALCYIMVDGDDTYPMENAREMANWCWNATQTW